MKLNLRKLATAVLFGFAVMALAMLSAAQGGKRTFTGKITDDECPRSDHSAMQMGSNDAECTVACVEVHGSSYVVFDGEHAYRLSDQTKPRQFSGQKVIVTGTLDTKTSTIQVDSIAAVE